MCNTSSIAKVMFDKNQFMIGVICWLNGIGHVISVGIVNFLLDTVDGRIWVWQHKNTALHDRDVMGTTAIGGGSVTVCFSLHCQLILHVLQGNLNGVAYHDNVLNAHVVLHFYNHPLADSRSLWTITPDRTELAL